MESAKELHRQLIVNHINACNQWGTALRQIILSIDGSFDEQSNQDGTAVLPDNEINVVQFLNVASTAHVIDAASPFAINPIEPIETLEPIESNNENVNDGSQPSTEQPKANNSKFGRFGRIIHI